MTTATLQKVTFSRTASTAEWAQRNVYLSSRIPTSEPGQWSPANVASLTRPGGFLDALDDPSVETVVVCKGSQTALTTTYYIWLMKELCEDPGSALLVMPSTQDAREKSSETWLPLWEDSPRLQDYMPTSRRKDCTKLYQRINGAPVYWVGANSPGRLSAKSIRRLGLDETDKYPSGFGRKGKATAARLTSSEAGAAALARQRTKAFRKKGLAKIVQFSTPTDERGEIWQEYQNGDQRQMFVKCHACGVEQIMVWANFKIDMDLAKGDSKKACEQAHYECQHCKAAWTDDQRWRAVDAGVWKPTAVPRDPKCHSEKHPSWLSKFVTVGYLAAQWIKAQESQSALQDFINSECAEPFVHVDNRISDAAFITLEGAYREGEIWTEVQPYKEMYADINQVTVIGCDVQKGYLVPTVVRAVQGVGYGTIWAGDVSSLSGLDKLAALHKADWIFLDQRYRTREIQEWCADHPGYVPCLGVSRRFRDLFRVASADLDEGKRAGANSANRVIDVIEFDPDMLKDILAAQLQAQEGAPQFLIPKGYAARPDYVGAMTAEICANGKWMNPRQKPDHIRDATLLALLGLMWLKFLRSAYDHPGEGG